MIETLFVWTAGDIFAAFVLAMGIVWTTAVFAIWLVRDWARRRRRSKARHQRHVIT